jgi:hypothetical protein
MSRSRYRCNNTGGRQGRRLRSAVVSLLQNGAHVVFDPVLAKVWSLDPSLVMYGVTVIDNNMSRSRGMKVCQRKNMKFVTEKICTIITKILVVGVLMCEYVSKSCALFL